MIIKELNLIGFGKFENKNIKLNKGLNIIYGENESGKSTIHSFIEGMFFGFLRPNVSSALYNEEHSKYDPWNINRYAGIIGFEFEGKDYRIERNFTRGKEETKILEEITGKEISKSIETGKTRISQPGIHFFGFNTRVFSNTIFIKQLQSITDKNLANDVREKLINVNTSLDDNISVDTAISKIDGLLGHIGSERAPTKPYAKNLNEIERLEREKETIEMEKEDYEFYLEEKSRLQDSIRIEDKNLSILIKQLDKVDLLEKKKILDDGAKIGEEIKSLRLAKEKLKDFANVSKKDYEEAITLNQSINHSSTSIKDMKSDLVTMLNKIKDFNPEDLESKNEKLLGDLNKDYSDYEELEREKQEIQYNKDDGYIRDLERDKSLNLDKKNKHKRNTTVLMGISLIAIVALYLMNLSSLFLFIPMIIMGIIAIYYIIGQKKIEEDRNKIEGNFDKIRSKEKLNQDRVEEIGQIQEKLLSNNNTKTKLELQALINKLQYEIYNKSEKEKQFIELEKEISLVEDKLKDHEILMDKNVDRLNQIFKQNNCENLGDLSVALDKRSLYEDNIKEVNSKEQLLERVLGKYTLEELKEEISKSQVEIDYEIDTDKQGLIANIDEKKTMIYNIKSELAIIEEKIKTLDKKISRLVEVEEEIYTREEQKKDLDNEILALNLAKSTIQQVSEEIHTEFAPEINRKLGYIVEKITSGKYNNIKISEDLDISLENPSTDEIIKIEGLSGGTIDQLYFALRFGIMDEITEKNLPLFLDDCFIQYDENRLKNVLEFLNNNIGERQVLLFTCHQREKNLLDDLGIDFNLINLT